MRNNGRIPPYWDAQLFAYLLPLLGAQLITAHGSYTFYSYLLPVPLAIAATVVLAVGVPLLEFAAVLIPGGRWGYLGGMLFLLFLEGLAQYFQGQAWFLQRIEQQFPNAQGVDLVTFAHEPRGRLLPILYLAALSLVVVGFGFAAARRIRELRSAHPRAISQTVAAWQYALREQLAEQLEQQLSTLRRQLTEAEQNRAEAEQRCANLEHIRAEAEQRWANLEQNAGNAERWRRESEQRGQELEQQRQLAAQYEAKAEHWRAEAERLRADLAQRAIHPAQPALITKQDVVACYQRLREAGQSERDAAQQMDITAATLRNWLEEVERRKQNGMELEHTTKV
jgi:hypothetical protein